jgi:hypothetical protein
MSDKYQKLLGKFFIDFEEQSKFMRWSPLDVEEKTVLMLFARWLDMRIGKKNLRDFQRGEKNG